MSKNKNSLNNRLPYGWTGKVQQILNSKGFQLNHYQIRDAVHRGISDKKLTAQILKALRQVVRDHEKESQKVAKLKATI
jgi:ethanolamine ammonia-lyase small subunit